MGGAIKVGADNREGYILGVEKLKLKKRRYSHVSNLMRLDFGYSLLVLLTKAIQHLYLERLVVLVYTIARDEAVR